MLGSDLSLFFMLFQYNQINKQLAEAVFRQILMTFFQQEKAVYSHKKSLRIKIKLRMLIQKQKMEKKQAGNTPRESSGEKGPTTHFYSYLLQERYL